MTEVLKSRNRRISRRAISAGLGLIAGVSALTGCGGDEKDTQWSIGVECAEGKEVKIEGTTNPVSKNVDKASINLSCEGEAPLSMQQLAGEGTNISDRPFEQVVEITAKFQDGDSYIHSDQDPSLDYMINEAGATIDLKGVRRIEQVEAVASSE